MPNIVDSLVLTLGLDASNFKSGTAEIQTALDKTTKGIQKSGTEIENATKSAANSIVNIVVAFDKTSEAADKSSKDVSKSSKDVSESIAKITSAALALFAVFTAGKGIKEFVQDITSTDAALGRLALRINQSPSDISAMANAVERFGGSSDEAKASMQGFSDQIQNVKVYGTSSLLPILNRLGLSTSLLGDKSKSLTDIYAEMADKLHALHERDPALADFMARQLGLDPNTAALLEKGRAAFLDALKQSEALGVAHKKDTEAAQALQTSWVTLTQAATDVGRTVLTAVSPALQDMLKWISEAIVANKDWIKTEFVEKIRQLGEWLKSINWSDVLKGLKDFANGAQEAATAVGGWLHIAEDLFALWAGAKFLKMMANIALMTRALTGGGLLTSLLTLFGAVAAGASAESTPGPGVSSDPVEREKERIHNQEVTDEANKGQGYTGGFWHDTTLWAKRKLGLAPTAGGGGGARLPGNRGQPNWWTPDRQSHAVDVLMKDAGLTENGAKALVSRWKNVESAGGPTSVNPSSGARGIAQWLDRHPQGDTGSFDEQLQAAAGELNTTESKAKRLLNVPGQEATGASAFERAEGYDPRTGRDNFTDRTAAGMADIAHNPATPAPLAATPPAAPQAGQPVLQSYMSPNGVISNEAMARYSKDRAAWLQAHQPPAPDAAKPTPPLLSYGLQDETPLHKAVKSLMDGPNAPVTAPGAMKMAPADFMQAGARAHAASLSNQIDNSRTSKNTSSVQTHIGAVNIATQATDAAGIARDIQPALKRGSYVDQVNYGLA